jgi:hypothetical protein
VTSNAPPRSGPPPRRSRPGLADWLDLLALLRRDEGLVYAELRRRDRAIGATLAELDPLAKLVVWVRSLREQDPAARSDLMGTRAAEALRLLRLGLVALGLLLGMSTALGALSFQPRGRINVVAVLVVLIGVPGLFLLLALANALPGRVRRLLPWVGSEPEGGGLLQPARWALRALPAGPRAALEQAWGRGLGLERLGAPVRRWLLLQASQGSAVAFNAGALAATLALVAFTDLSFGWSSTLAIDAAQVHRVSVALSAPWAWAWPDARPSLGLLETTRFFRIAAAPDPGVPLTTYGGWWPFVVMCLAVYGLLPRLLFLVFARMRLARSLARAVREAPGCRALLDRLESPLLETQAREGETLRPDDADGAGALEAEAADGPPLPTRAVLIRWSDALTPAATNTLGVGTAACFEAGGRQSPEQDAEVVVLAAAAARDARVPVVIAVRGFEPPLAEVLDFLRALRAALGDASEIVVAAVGGGGVERSAWRRSLASTGDPWLVLARASAHAGAAGS